MKKSKKISRTERLEIEVLIGKGYALREIARALARSPNTISYELKRNGGRNGYHALHAHQYARTRKRLSRFQWKKIEHDDALKAYIIAGLRKYWNPDEIAGKMREERQPFYASKTAIYEWLRSVYGQRHCPYLYSGRYYRKKRKAKKERIMIPRRVSIEQRPLGATNRTRYGHWETDAIVSRKGCSGGMQTSSERKSRLIVCDKRTSMRPKETVAALRRIARAYLIHSATYDNGIENRFHTETGIPSYFCDPYSSWQKGSVENANKMIRRFFPKGTDFSAVSQNNIDRVVSIINHKPRKILGYRTALEVARASGIIRKQSVLIEG